MIFYYLRLFYRTTEAHLRPIKNDFGFVIMKLRSVIMTILFVKTNFRILYNRLNMCFFKKKGI